MKDEHGVTLLESDMQEIQNIVLECESEQCNIANVVGRSEQLCRCGKPEEKAYSPCCSLTCWCEQFE